MPVRPVRPLVLSLTFVVAALSACSDTSTNLAAGTGQNMSLSFSGRAPVPVSGAMSVASAQTDTLVQASGSDTLRITSVGIVPPLVVDASGSSTNLTIRLDVSTWFRVGGTGTVIDPSTANPGGANEGAVKDNIKHSVKAFRDENHDGDEHNG